MGQPQHAPAGQDGHRAAQAQVVAELAVGEGLDAPDALDARNASSPDGEDRQYRRDAVILRLEGRRRRRGSRS